MKYPYDIVSIVRQKTLSIEAHFTQGKTESPMKVFDDTFSRFAATIIAEGETAYFNIPIESLPGIRVRTDIAANEQFRPKAIIPKSTANSTVDTNSIAFTKKFLTGNLKGKSPAEVLLEDPVNGSKTLNNQYKWLKEHLKDYPKNKDLMDAIVAASKLDLSNITEADTGSMVSSAIEILDIGCRPLIRKQRDDGKIPFGILAIHRSKQCFGFLQRKKFLQSCFFFDCFDIFGRIGIHFLDCNGKILIKRTKARELACAGTGFVV